jgi:UTP--glucose-1-phosphate uridylyltransferase
MAEENNIIRKAVIPAAGLGIRLLPATKSQPKEMLPVVDKPALQYVVEEAIASGIDDIVIITGRGKSMIEDHFDKSVELEQVLKEKGKLKALENIKNISNIVEKIHYVRQKEPKGLGDAILCAKKHIGNEPFVVLLGDTIITSSYKTCTRQLMDVYSKYKKPVIAVQKVDKNRVSRFGIIKPKLVKNSLYLVKGMIEKPKRREAPSNLAIMGRYVLTPDIFDIISKTKPGYNGEIQITDAMASLKKLYAYEFEGNWLDIGSRLEWISANISLALNREDIGKELKEELCRLLKISK